MPADIWVVRHAVNSVFGWVGVVFAFLLGRAARSDSGPGGWRRLLLLSMPRYVGESMNNPKDLPFATLMLAALLFHRDRAARRIRICRGATPRSSAIAIALTLNVRAMGLVLLGYAALAMAVADLRRGRLVAGDRLAKTRGRVSACVAVVALVAGTAFWPWAQEQPLRAPVRGVLLTASGFSWGNPSLFGGRDVPSTELPWHYLPTWVVSACRPSCCSARRCRSSACGGQPRRASNWRPSGRSC